MSKRDAKIKLSQRNRSESFGKDAMGDEDGWKTEIGEKAACEAGVVAGQVESVAERDEVAVESGQEGVVALLVFGDDDVADVVLEAAGAEGMFDDGRGEMGGVAAGGGRASV